LVEVEFGGQADGECLSVGLHCRSNLLECFQVSVNKAGRSARCLGFFAEYSCEQVAMSAMACRVSFA
jgi:hypothetical protein